MKHLTPDELVAWRDAPAESARERVVGHLASCDECTAAYAEVIRTRPAEGTPSSFDERAFAERGYAAGRGGRPPLVWRSRLLMPLAAAAVIMLAVFLPRGVREPAPEPDVNAVRGTRLETVRPSGETAGPLEFRWASPFTAARYVVEVTDGRGQRVAMRETTAERLDADAALDAALRPGVAYLWTVSAVDAAGEVIARSTPRAFSRAGPQR